MSIMRAWSIILALVGASCLEEKMASIERVTHTELGESLLSQTATAQRRDGDQEIPLVKGHVGPGRGCAWRVGLQRLARADGRAPIIFLADAGRSVPTFLVARYPFASGFQTTPQDPPRRANPVFGLHPADPGAFGSVFVELSWGTSAGQPSRLIADWPALGAEVVVSGNYADVTAGVHLSGSDSMVDGDMPVMTATLVADAGAATPAAGELSLSYNVTIKKGTGAFGGAPGGGAVVYVPDYARRIQIHAGDTGQGLETGIVPLTGDRPLQLTWFDDNGRICWTGFQRTSEPVAAGTPANAPVMWNEVPARAVLLQINTNLDLGIDEALALVHWRIAP